MEEGIVGARREQIDLLLRRERGERGSEAEARIGVQRGDSAAKSLGELRVGGEPAIDLRGHARVRRARSVGARNDGIGEGLQAIEFRRSESYGLRVGR